MNTKENTAINTQISDAELDNVTGGVSAERFFKEVGKKISFAGKVIKALISGDDDDGDIKKPRFISQNGASCFYCFKLLLQSGLLRGLCQPV